jgi:polyhydroxybutyrate depolymerase
MKHLFTALLALVFACQIAFSQTLITKTISHNNETRQYAVFLPASYTAASTLPMVINMHGYTSDVQSQIFYSGFNGVANTANVIVVYPQGLHRTLANGTSGTHWNSHFLTDVDDLGFIDTLIDYMYTDYHVDLSRVYATGMSNGGFMSYMLACELSDRIAAMASVTGAMTYLHFPNCAPSHATPVMQIHGTSDGTVLFNGGPGFHPSIDSVVNWWKVYNNCQSTTTTNLPNTNTTDNTTASLTVHSQCTDNVEVHYYVVQDGGHTWPGAIPIASLGNTNQDFNATQKIWEFFSQYQHPNPQAGVILSNQNVLSQEIVKVFPNPVNDILNIAIENEDIEQITLFDTMGKTIQNWQTPNTSVFSLSMKHLNTGVYFLQVETNNGVTVQKVIKN